MLCVCVSVNERERERNDHLEHDFRKPVSREREGGGGTEGEDLDHFILPGSCSLLNQLLSLSLSLSHTHTHTHTHTNTHIRAYILLRHTLSLSLSLSHTHTHTHTHITLFTIRDQTNIQLTRQKERKKNKNEQWCKLCLHRAVPLIVLA